VTRSPSFPYIAPFAALLVVLGLSRAVPLPEVPKQIVVLAVMGVALWLCRSVIDLRVRHWAGTMGVGVVVFVIWIGPDLLFPGYRQHWVFTNSLMGSVSSGLPDAVRGDPAVLALRFARAAVVVPIAEEVFWRAWLMRWLISPKFEEVPLGARSPQSFWIVALLFASEHGAFWDVGLAAGVIYNLWMLRTQRLGDLILAHSVTNACLSAYVIATGRWEYWG
jgi:CAAX prenyl protease-like protein